MFFVVFYPNQWYHKKYKETKKISSANEDTKSSTDTNKKTRVLDLLHHQSWTESAERHRYEIIS